MKFEPWVGSVFDKAPQGPRKDNAETAVYDIAIARPRNALMFATLKTGASSMKVNLPIIAPIQSGLRRCQR